MLLLFNQLIRFVNGDIRSFFFARADCRTKSGGYAIISRPDIATVKDLKGKRLTINTFGTDLALILQQIRVAQCRVSGEKHLKLEFPVAERFSALYREQFNPDLRARCGGPWEH